MAWRKIKVKGIDYKYIVGRIYVAVRKPNGKVLAGTLSKVTGQEWDTMDGMVTPKQVEKFIRENT